MLNAIPEKDFYQIKNIKVKRKKDWFFLTINKNNVSIDGNEIFGKYVKEMEKEDHILYNVELPSNEEIQKELNIHFKDYKCTDTTNRKMEVREYLFKLFFGASAIPTDHLKFIIDDAIDITISSDMKKGRQRLFNLAVQQIMEKRPELMKHRFLQYYPKEERHIIISYSIYRNSKAPVRLIRSFDFERSLCGTAFDDLPIEYMVRVDKLAIECIERIIGTSEVSLEESAKIEEVLPEEMERTIEYTIKTFEEKEKNAIETVKKITEHNIRILQEFIKRKEEIESDFNREILFEVIQRKSNREIKIDEDRDPFEVLMENTKFLLGHKKVMNKWQVYLDSPHSIINTKNKKNARIDHWRMANTKNTLNVHVVDQQLYECTEDLYCSKKTFGLRYFVEKIVDHPATFNIYVVGERWRELTARDFEKMKQHIRPCIYFLGECKENNGVVNDRIEECINEKWIPPRLVE